MTKQKVLKYSSYILIIAGISLVLYPFLPHLILLWNRLTDDTDGYVYDGQLAREQNIDPDELKPIPSDDRLVIPEIQLDAPIMQGDSPKLLKQGVWQRSGSAQPGGGGNIVILGHRWGATYTFYHLNKLEPGDQIIIFWDQIEHGYMVDSIFEVEPDETWIESKADQERLTLYTCSPLHISNKRLVIFATPVDKEAR